jgi:multicomponent Na+:H+ antiporter subunit E
MTGPADGGAASGRPRGSRGPGWTARLRPRVVEIVWLTLVWVLLWGTFTPLSIVGGIVVATAVIASFRFPPAAAHLPVRPLRLLGLAAYLAYDVGVSGVEVSWQTLRYGRTARGAVIVVRCLAARTGWSA